MDIEKLHRQLHEFGIPHSDSDFNVIEILKQNPFNIPDTIPFAINSKEWSEGRNGRKN